MSLPVSISKRCFEELSPLLLALVTRMEENLLKGQKGETKKGAKSRAQSVAREDQNADAAPAPIGGGKGGKGEGKSSTGVPFNQICYHHNHGGCKRGKDCKFKHVQLTDKVQAEEAHCV